MQNRKKPRLIFIAIAAMCLAVLPQFSPTVKAAGPPQFSRIAVRLDNSNYSTGTAQYTGGTVCIATPASAYTGEGTENYVDIGFPNEQGVTITTTTDFQVSTTLSNWTTNVTDPGAANAGMNYWPLLQNTTNSAWPAISVHPTSATNGAYSSGQVTSTKVIRLSATVVGNAFGLAHANTYCFNWTGGNTATTYALQNAAKGTNGWQENVPGFIETYDCIGSAVTCAPPGATGTGSEIMASNWGTQLTANNSIIVTAVVPPIFELTFGANADTFKTNLDPNTPVQTTGVGVTVATNAKGGWVMWEQSANQALTSVSSGGSIPTVPWNADAPTTLAPGTAQYALNIGVTSGVGTSPTLCGSTPGTANVEPEYNGTLGSFQGGALEANWSEIADCSTSTPPGTDGGTTVTLTELAEITFSTPAATDYTDTIYVAGAGQF